MTVPQPPSPQEVAATVRRKLTLHDPLRLQSRLRDGTYAPVEDHLTTLWGHRAIQTRDSSKLMVLPALRHRIEVLPHQVNAAIRVLNKMGTRAILADEVGLGKTIEAGIVMKELIAKGLAERVLILTPASLVTQWKEEMNIKFREDFITHEDPGFEGFDAHDKIIASIDTAKLDKHVPDIISQDWDLTIVDEAHYLKNRATQRYRLMETLFTRYLLMLTATPMQNTLKELFNLIHVCRPGLLGSEAHFQKSFMGDTAGRKLLNARDLQRLLREVMIRNRRSETGLKFPSRNVETHRIEASDEEYRLNDHLVDFIREHYQGAFHLPLVTLQREVASSAPALISTLKNMLESDSIEDVQAYERLVKHASEVKTNAKADFVTNLLSQMGDKVIVYTQFRHTQDLLMGQLRDAGVTCVAFNGSMNQRQKAEAIERFRGPVQALVCTDSGSEGLNLQFAHVLINYDLPWNPMRVEQRIGRVHRIGQENDVVIINLTLKDTIEDYVLEVLYEKIRLFEVAIGEMDLILSNMPDAESLDTKILQIIAKSRDKKDLKKSLRDVSRELEGSKKAAEDMKSFDEEIFRHMDLGTVKGAEAEDEEEELEEAVRRARAARKGGDGTVTVEEGEDDG
ncbi:MAG: DEAD/DEAH box helicase [Euryarchaeota archaeon]|nr:DEAD/DEAH box helicase [Euryarchaeota archaeon]